MNYCDGWEDPDNELVLPLFLSFSFMLSKSSKMLRSPHVHQGSHVRLGCSTFMDQAPSLVAIHFWVHCSPLMKEPFAFSLKEVGSGERTMMAVHVLGYLIVRGFWVWNLSFKFFRTLSHCQSYQQNGEVQGFWSLMATSLNFIIIGLPSRLTASTATKLSRLHSRNYKLEVHVSISIYVKQTSSIRVYCWSQPVLSNYTA